MEWFLPNKKPIFWQEIANNITSMVNQGFDHKIIIGTDSQPVNNGTVFVVAVCIISDKENFSRTFYWSKKKLPKIYDLYSRISQEAQFSIEVANQLRDYSSTLKNDLNISIHIDVSSDSAKTKTSKYSNALINLVKAYDYPDVEIKPNSWAASSIADKYTK